MNNDRGITVREALGVEKLKDAKVLAGQGGLDRVITQVNVMEVPDICEWVKEGEFLITAAYSIKDDIEAQKRLIPDLASKGVAAIAIKTKRYIERLPEEVIEAGDILNFPIIEIPSHISFTDIISPITNQIFTKQASLIIKMEQIHKKLMEVVLEGGGLKEIADTLSIMLDNPVAIIDNVFDERAITFSKISDHMKQSIEDIYTNKNSYSYDDAKDVGGYYKIEDKMEDTCISRIVIPIIASKKVYGYIWVWEISRRMTSFDILSIQSSAMVTALQLIKKVAVQQVENRYKSEFVEDILSQDKNVQSMALERAAFFGWDYSKDYVVILIKVKSLDKYFNYNINKGEYFNTFKNNLTSEIEVILRARKIKYMIAGKRDITTLLVGMDPNIGTMEVKKLTLEIAKEIYKASKVKLNNSNIDIAIGRYYSGVENLWKSYKDAKGALSYKTPEKSNIVHYDHLGVYRILSSHNCKDELIKFYQEFLDPLVEYDKAKEGDLVRTLDMYFQCNGNAKKMSQNMFTHYNTIVYRLQRIEEITKINLDSPQDRLNMQIALGIMGLIDSHNL